MTSKPVPRATPLILALVLAAAPAFAVLPDSTPSLPEPRLLESQAPAEPPYRRTAFTWSAAGMLFPYLGGSGWGLVYAGAPDRALIGGGAQASGFFIVVFSSLYYSAHCLLPNPEAPQSGCGEALAGMIGGMGLNAAGVLYSFFSIPGAVRREQRRKARAAVTPILLPGPEDGFRPGLALRVDW